MVAIDHQTQNLLIVSVQGSENNLSDYISDLYVEAGDPYLENGQWIS